MRTLVLWDIDHTLLSIAGLSGEIYAAAFREVVGWPLERVAVMAGRTDRAITAETLRLHGVDPDEELVVRFTDALGRGFAERRHEIASRGRALPGARAGLEALASRPDVVQSLLTGNMESIARCKLAAFGLDGLVDFGVGAYGMDGVERPPLVRLARERAEAKYGEPFGPGSTVLVGDTPLDVAAGHQGGARVVAVATGASDEAALRDAGAELVLADLRDTDAVVRAVLDVSRI
ncbi:haloacid dehalogenase-like hydrolase [Actinomadura kijaniata]|uniref:Phosphoglycolate phosphatase-like HAD superfamily hydrolase n=1 Tax=Actinomadura namibiensis TaxID=182080 RepID=A0A7W3LQC4_ACTNM|nr:haloacid dehalogenase-like hydrolase [Actinomadura namibiensis]MBA8952344.1 phosphoglycolate phosphatase-like HAD superfamily hydrolase [Actinomadura namibiensis]